MVAPLYGRRAADGAEEKAGHSTVREKVLGGFEEAH
jgi:hypothetical protein